MQIKFIHMYYQLLIYIDLRGKNDRSWKNLLFASVPQHVVFKVALSIKALTAIFGACKGLFTAMNTHMHHIVLANAEYFSTLMKSASEGLRACMQMQMLIEAGLSSEDLHTAFVLALEFFVNFTFLWAFTATLNLGLRRSSARALYETILIFLLTDGRIWLNIGLCPGSFSQNWLRAFQFYMCQRCYEFCWEAHALQRTDR